MPALDEQIRLRAFAWLQDRSDRTSWPDPDALDARYQRFKRAS
jgi:hypothetical protein